MFILYQKLKFILSILLFISFSVLYGCANKSIPVKRTEKQKHIIKEYDRNIELIKCETNLLEKVIFRKAVIYETQPVLFLDLNNYVKLINNLKIYDKCIKQIEIYNEKVKKYKSKINFKNK